MLSSVPNHFFDASACAQHVCTQVHLVLRLISPLTDVVCWQVGEFQCYDRRARASLSQTADAVGRPEWGYSGPHDAGSYNSMPEVSPAPQLRIPDIDLSR